MVIIILKEQDKEQVKIYYLNLNPNYLNYLLRHNLNEYQSKNYYRPLYFLQ